MPLFSDYFQIMIHTYSDSDTRFMQKALDAAQAAKGYTFPNPAVGAVVVKSGRMVGIGATDRCGGPHAEIVALNDAALRSRGATLYVTLEPCNHHGRTPPCTNAIIDAGITSVVAAVRDPNPLVAGKGLRALSRAGIAVRCGLLKNEATRLNEDFFYAIVHKRAFVTLKLALTLDGRIADHSGHSKWITSASSRTLVHQLRRSHAAIAIGKQTLLADDPMLTVRHLSGPSPARIVFASDAVIPKHSYFATHAGDVRSIIVAAGAPFEIKEKLSNGMECWHPAGDSMREQLASFLRMAYQEGLTSILVEGGAKLASSFLENGLVNRIYLFYGNKILGSGLSGLQFNTGLTISNAISLKKIEHCVVDEDRVVTGLVS